MNNFYQMNRYVRWGILNGIFAVSIYYGFFEGVSGAENIALFMGWFTGVVGTIAFLSEYVRKETIKSLLEKEAKMVPYPIDLTFDLVVIGVFIWTGMVWLPIMYLLSMFGSYRLQKDLKEWAGKSLIEKLKGDMVEGHKYEG